MLEQLNPYASLQGQYQSQLANLQAAYGNQLANYTYTTNTTVTLGNWAYTTNGEWVRTPPAVEPLPSLASDDPRVWLRRRVREITDRAFA